MNETEIFMERRHESWIGAGKRRSRRGKGHTKLAYLAESSDERFIHLPQTNNRSWNRRAQIQQNTHTQTHSQRYLHIWMRVLTNEYVRVKPVKRGKGSMWGGERGERKRVAWHCQWRRECHKQRHIFKSVQNGNFRSLSKWKINSRL